MRGSECPVAALPACVCCCCCARPAGRSCRGTESEPAWTLQMPAPCHVSRGRWSSAYQAKSCLDAQASSCASASVPANTTRGKMISTTTASSNCPLKASLLFHSNTLILLTVNTYVVYVIMLVSYAN